MKTELVHALTSTFETHARQTESGVEFWLARDIQKLLGYAKWDNFLNVLANLLSVHHCALMLDTKSRENT